MNKHRIDFKTLRGGVQFVKKLEYSNLRVTFSVITKLYQETTITVKPLPLLPVLYDFKQLIVSKHVKSFEGH